MINHDIRKHLNIFLPFPDQATPSIFKNNLRIILASKPEKIQIIEAQKKLVILIKKCILTSLFVMVKLMDE